MEHNTNYYKITVSYEIPYNVLDSQDPNQVQAREILYSSLKNIIPGDYYEKFSVKLTLYQLRDSLNYLVTFDAFFRSITGLPMENYVKASDIKDKVCNELESFFNSLDCDFKQINIKPLV